MQNQSINTHFQISKIQHYVTVHYIFWCAIFLPFDLLKLYQFEHFVKVCLVFHMSQWRFNNYLEIKIVKELSEKNSNYKIRKFVDYVVCSLFLKKLVCVGKYFLLELVAIKFVEVVFIKKVYFLEHMRGETNHGQQSRTKLRNNY